MSSSHTTYLFVFLLIITINGLDGIDKYRIFSHQKPDTFSLNLMLRCPLAWSENDTITFSAQVNNNNLPIQNFKGIRESFVVDSIISYGCTVTNKYDGSKESVMFYIYKENKFKEQMSDNLTFYVSGLEGDFNFYPKQCSSDRKLKGSIIESKSGKDVSKKFKFKWYFFKSNKKEYSINELADKVVISDDGEISFIGMKNPQQVLTAQCFATNGVTNLTSPSFLVDVNKAKQMPDGFTFYVSGLDGDFNFYPKEGSNDRKLKGSIIESKSKKDVSKDFKFKWYFLKQNKEEYPNNELADKVVISDDGEISFIGMKNPGQDLTAQFVATNGVTNYTSPTFSVNVLQDIDKRPKLHFNKTIGPKSDFPEKLFCINERVDTTEISIGSISGKPIPKDWIKSETNSVTVIFPVEQNFIAEYEGSYYCYSKNKFGSDNTTITIKAFELLSIVVNSTINKMTKENKEVLNTIIRSNRKLQLDCHATGEPNVEIQWYIITEKYEPDIPVPSEKVPLIVGEKSQYVVERITDKHYRVTREFYSKDNIDSLLCEAKLKGISKNQRITIQEAKEIFKVDFATEQGTSLRQQVFVDKPFRVSCEMKDKMRNVVKVKNFNWTFKGPNNENIPLHKIAGQKTNTNGELILTNITLKYGSYIRGQCVAWYNDTYDVYSEEFTLNLQESPKIYNIHFNQIFPEKKFNLYPPYNITYNSTKKTAIQCIANVSSNSVAKITWLKCKDNDCKNSAESSPTPTLLFVQKATRHYDEGIYKCLVKLEVGGSEVLNQTVILNVLRAAQPKEFTKQESNLNSFSNMNLICSSDSSPEGNTTWSFIPRGKTEEQNIPKEAEVSNNDNRIYQLKIKKPLKAEYDGIYICKIENQYGVGGMKFDVKIDIKFKRLLF